jgi:hypothetical protein
MAIKFDELLDDGDEAAVIDPRDIFLTLNRDKKFAFPRDIQTEVMKAWFELRNNPDTEIERWQRQDPGRAGVAAKLAE